MAAYELTFASVSLPTNSGGVTVTVEEDLTGDGTTDTSDTITLTDGVTNYVTDSGDFDGSGQVALSFNLGPPSDVSVTASTLLPVDVEVVPALQATTATTTSSGQPATVVQDKTLLAPAVGQTASTGVDSTLFESFGPSRVPSAGWSVSVTHPVSGRVVRPSVINPRSVQYIPGPNSLPRVRLPVRVNAGWLDSGFNNNPSMSVYLDGEELPIDELVDVEHEEGKTILVGEGGRELRQRVSAEYDSAERPAAATSLVSSNTSYSVVDNTSGATQTTSTVQSPSGEAELQGLISPPASTPLVFGGGGLHPAQTCFTVEAEDKTQGTVGTTTGWSGTNGEDFSGGDSAGVLFNGVGEYAEFDFTTDYTIPGSSFDVAFRWDKGSDTGTGNRLEFSIDGESLGVFEPSGTGVMWATSGDLANRTTISDLGSGSHTLRVEQIQSDDDSMAIDVVAPYDTRYSYTFDNSVDANGFLSGPEYYPPSVDAEFDAYESAFSVVAGSVTATLSDTTNNQALALSNDRGNTYPISGSNTTSISGSFPSTGGTINLQASLSRYSPSGTRTQTPTTGYDRQRLDSYSLDATIEAESLLIDESYDNTLVSVLNSVLPPQYGWTYSIEGGTPTFTVDEPGSTAANRDPEITESRIRKQVQTYSTVTIKGSTIPVSGEEFQASTSFVNLEENNILTGSEAVYTTSGGTNFTRGTDYEMNYSTGEIKILSSGDMSSGTTYAVDYRHQVQASYTAGVGSSDELIRTVPGVVTDRQAEQIAFVLAEVYPGVSTPRYEGRIVVPRLDVNFDPLEGLQLADLDLPSVATPLSIRGEPELTPLGLTLSLGSAPRLEESLRAISQQVSSLSDRV